MDSIEHSQELLKDYLTFYHEIRIPQNDFFIHPQNEDWDSKVLIVSSPSRMGNHLLLSMLDNHPELPRVPGDDGFHSFSFYQANYDLYDYLNRVVKNASIDHITNIASNYRGNKWKLFYDHYIKKSLPIGYSGITADHDLAIVDFEETLFEINYNRYEGVLRDGIENLPSHFRYKDILNIYYNAFMFLDPQFQPGGKIYDYLIVFSGMRTQSKWLLKYYENAKLIVSIRPFESYVFSHVRSRYGDITISSDHIQEAWEHWYHKTIDYIFLKIKYPQKVCLVMYNDLISETENTAKAIAKFIGVEFEKSLLNATIFGVQGMWNSSV